MNQPVEAGVGHLLDGGGAAADGLDRGGNAHLVLGLIKKEMWSLNTKYKISI